MPTQQHINTYGGLNQDTAFDSIQPNMYIDASDVRISTTDGESNGAITNIEGNSLSFTIDQTGATGIKEIIGHCVLRNYIILFCADDSNTKGWIYYISYDEKTRDITSTGGNPVLVYYNAALNFKKANPIEAIGRFENTNTQRIYFTDYFEPLRSMNIASVLNGGGALTTDLGLLDIFPLVDYTQPIITNIGGGGNLLVGEYQFAYRLTTFDGKKTLISPPGVLTHITSDDDNGSRTAEYMGDPKDTLSAKSIEVTIDTTNYKTKYEKIELISLFYNTYGGTPEITSVESQIISSTANTIIFVYTGLESTITTITSIEFAIKVYPFATCKTMVPKDNSLVVANIKETRFSIQELLVGAETFDANALRYLKSSTTLPAAGDARKFNTLYNSDAHWDDDWHLETGAGAGQYKFQNNNTTLGGEAAASGGNPANIKYKFTVDPFLIDGNNVPGFANLANTGPQANTNLADGYSHPNKTFTSFASPYLSGLTKGYKRGDTYRFGIVFYNLKGEASFVEYIGDIKFPDISEIDGATNGTGTNYWPICKEVSANTTTAYNLGIEITVDFTSCPSLLTKLSGYQIVRVDRQNKDKRRICSGLLKNFVDFRMGPAGSNYNFEGPAGEVTVYHLGTEDQNPGGVTSENGTFNFLSNKRQVDLIATAAPLDTYHTIKEDSLAFYSPEISYDFNGSFNSGINGAASGLLITGAYGDFVYSNTNNVPAAGSLGPSYFNGGIIDSRLTIRNSQSINKTSALGAYTGANTLKRGIEYVKKFKDLTKAPYFINSDDSLATYIIDGVNYRNWISDFTPGGSGSNNRGLNDPNNPNNSISSVSQGTTCLIGKIEKFVTDPITATAIPVLGQSSESGFANYTSTGGITPVGDEYAYVTPTSFLKNQSTPITDYIVFRSEIYGGMNDGALETNAFVPCSPVVDIVNNKTFKVFGGDMFISMWTHQFGVVPLYDSVKYHPSTGNDRYFFSTTNTAIFPVETTINIALAYGTTLKTGVQDFWGPAPNTRTQFRQEEENLSASGGAATVAKVLNMYKGAYNTAYSINQTQSGLGFFVKPSTILASGLTNDIRGYLSDVKINGEATDSWTIFRSNNYYDVESDHGPINKIVNWRDEVYFFQDTGVGAYSINPRAVTTTTDGQATELGSGQGFAHHQYITTENGSIHQWGVKTTNTGIYYYDATHSKIFRVGEGNSPLSEIKGMHSFLSTINGNTLLRKENGGDNPILGKGITMARDMINDEVLFSFHGRFTLRLVDNRVFTYYPGEYVYYITGPDTFYFIVNAEFTTTTNLVNNIALVSANCTQITDAEFIIQLTTRNNTTLVFDELAQTFSSLYSAVPSTYLENGNILLSPNPSSKANIFVHNKGNFGEFYGAVKEASVKLVINPNADINKILRFLEFNSTVRDKGKAIDRTKTITAFRVQTQYQDTNKVAYSAANVKRRFDKWRLKIPRDQLSTSKRGRLRSTFFTLTLYYDNTYNKELILNRIMSHYDIQVY